MQVELTQTQMNAVERMHADVERRILLARVEQGISGDFLIDVLFAEGHSRLENAESLLLYRWWKHYHACPLSL